MTTVFKDELVKNGIGVDGNIEVLQYGDLPQEARRRWTLLAEHLSPPLVRALEVINKRSNNLHAEMLLRTLGAEVKAVDCPAIDGIIEEADDVAGEIADKAVLDAALINAAQAAEHYEITRYGSLIAWARQLGRNDCAGILQQTLDEEKKTDTKLTSLAEGKVNLRAAS